MIKSKEELRGMREAGRLAAEVLDMITNFVKPGISTGELDKICHDHIVKEQKAIPANVGYRGFEKTLCTSLNQVVCHGIPDDKRYFGVCKEVITELGSTTPILGVCLGHQGIISCFGGKVVNAGNVRHGKTSQVKHYDDSIFNGIKNPFRATRYHSLVGDKTIIPDSLKITAVAEDDGEVMGVSHKKYLIEGVQFHPESILTDEGTKILGNFIERVKNIEKN